MSDEVNKTESENEIPNPKDEESDVLSKIKSMFGEEICNAFEREEITTESTLADLILRDADAPIFTRLGLNYGRTLRLQKEFSHLSKQTKRHPHGAPSSKPSLVDLSQMSSEIKQLYYVKRKKIGTHVAKTWGKNLPIFNTPEAKAELEALAESLEPECGIKEINFGADGIAQHIKNFCYEQRRYEKGRKRQHVEPSPTPKAPGKHKKTKSSAESPTARRSVPFKMAANEEDDIPYSHNESDEKDNKEDKPYKPCICLSQTGGFSQNDSGEVLGQLKTYINLPSQSGDDSQRFVDIALGITEPPSNFVPLNIAGELDHEDSDRTAAWSSDTSSEPLVGSSQRNELNDRKQIKELQKSVENITIEKVRNNKPQEESPQSQITKEFVLHKFLQKPTYENVTEDNIVLILLILLILFKKTVSR